jgi:hypothetical protein
VLTERHRSRTCPASGYDALLVLKTSWATGPGRSVTECNESTSHDTRRRELTRARQSFVNSACGPESARHCRAARRDLELLEDVLDVLSDGVRGDDERRGDLA